MKTWQERIQAPADPLFERFTSSVVQDRRLAPYDVQASRAHALALIQAGIVTPEDGEQLLQGLTLVAEEVRAGAMQWRDELEDVHTHVEDSLRQKLGPLAGALHAGRSRNDQIAADLRLYVTDCIRHCLARILDLQEPLLALASRYRTTIMPGYTHLQQAQPVLTAQCLLAYVAMLGRDWERFRDALPRAAQSPLGAGALAGSTFPLNRAVLAAEAGFAGVLSNSLDAVSDRDFLVEFVNTAALCMTHLSRFSEDLILWSSTEYGFVRLPDSFASGSSMMPQKKNPDVAELVRGKAALVLGDAAAALALVKGLPLGYNRDLQEDKTPLYHAADTLLSSLQILAAMTPELEFNTERMEAAISSFTLATDLADLLVQRGVPFREAHGVVARAVGACVAAGQPLHEACIPDLGEMPDLSPRASVERKATDGSTNPEEVARQMNVARQTVDERRAWLASVESAVRSPGSPVQAWQAVQAPERTGRKRDLLSIADLTADELRHILSDAIRIKEELQAGITSRPFAQKTLLMVFEKPSLRTRVSFETGMTQFGGHAIYLTSADIGIGKREPLSDMAEVLSRMGDMIMARTYAHATIEEIAQHSRVPVINGLSDLEHPCQILADLQTMREVKGRLDGLRVAFYGDGENNITHSLALAAGLLGMHLTVCSPPGYTMNPDILAHARLLGAASGGTISETSNPQEAAAGSDIVYTDTWISMGDEQEAGERLRHFAPYRVTPEVMRQAKPDAIFMHDMPAYRGNEVTAEVIDGPQSVIYQQAANRLHAQKAAMLFLVRESGIVS